MHFPPHSESILTGFLLVKLQIFLCNDLVKIENIYLAYTMQKARYVVSSLPWRSLIPI